MNRKKLLKRLVEGALRNVAFGDMINLAEVSVFAWRGSAAVIISSHPAIAERINLQEVKGEAKPCQIRQFLALLERYNLALEEGE